MSKNSDKIKCIRLNRESNVSKLNVHGESDNPIFKQAIKEYADLLMYSRGYKSHENTISCTTKMGFRWDFFIDCIILPFNNDLNGIPHLIKVNKGYEYEDPNDDPDLFAAAIELLCKYDNKGNLVAPNIVKITVMQPFLNRKPDSVILSGESLLERASEISNLLSSERSVSIGDHCLDCENKCSDWLTNQSEKLLEFESTNLLNACILNVKLLSGDQLSKILASKALILSSLLMAENEVSERISAGQVVGKCFSKKGAKLKNWNVSEEEDLIIELKKLGIPKTKCYTKTLISPAKALRLIGDIKDTVKEEKFKNLIFTSTGAERIGTVEEQEKISLINFNKAKEI